MTDTPQILLQHHLKQLRLPTFHSEYAKPATQCAAEGKDHAQYLLRLCELELIERERRMIERRIKAAKFPATKSLDSFDFKVIPSLNKALTIELARCESLRVVFPAACCVNLFAWASIFIRVIMFRYSCTIWFFLPNIAWR